ncbi:hypothetical protein Poli38472_001674 [Pythium oligandrum]|uniref:Uncharacterized protein n=1 Tax=Pythium oligandrum TaxID=41045 RepID=A0A8K1CWH1_PYTOL|nr:hypothetical protein Poli38472_001674 [Pythium oligandrum]|eukprot:TMW69518.1 hypothetical protein Poli38472_001674 [Pythium oligandrum]
MVKMATPAAANYNVRELLELERKIYQESIDRNALQHEALMKGTLEEYVVKCLPFETERDNELEAAMMRLEYNKRNAFDVLEMELKQAEDVYQEQRRVLKRELTMVKKQRRDEILKRLKVLEQGEAPQKVVEPAEESQDTPLRPVLRDDSSVDTIALRDAVHESLAANQAAFNMQHLAYNIPTAEEIVTQVMDEATRLREQREQDQLRQEDRAASVNVELEQSRLTIGSHTGGLDTVFHVDDHVILWSAVSDEEFYGQIAAFKDDQVALTLVCETPVHVGFDQLRSGQCTLKHQTVSTPPPAEAIVDDGRQPLTPRDPRKRHRRKHTTVLRQML